MPANGHINVPETLMVCNRSGIVWLSLRGLMNVSNSIASVIARARNALPGRVGSPEPATVAAAPRSEIEASSSGDFDLRQIGQGLWRKRIWIALPTIAVAILSFLAVNMVTPRYKSEARILVDGRENIFLRPNAETRDNSSSTPDAEAVTSQVQLVLSRDLARRVIAKNKLAELPEFDPVLNGVSPLKSLLSLIGIGRDPLRMTAEERVMEAYYDRLVAYAVDRSRVITIEFQSINPDLAAQVANSIADGFLELQQTARQDQARSASQWLSGEIDNLRKRVSDAESRVEDFRSKTNLFVGLNNTTLSAQQLGELSTQLNTARAQKAEADSKASMIRGMLQSGRPIEASDVLNSELVRRLNEQRVTLSAQLAEQSSTLLNGHPRIKELRAQISDIDRQIRDEASKFARALENDARISAGRVDTLSASLDQVKKQASSTNSQDVELRALEREAKAQRDLLESYLAKYREATARENIDTVPADARIISRAVVSNTPAYPKKLPIVVIATLATFLLCAGFIVTGELLRMASPPARLGAPLMRHEPAAPARTMQPVASVSDIEHAVEGLHAAGESARRIAIAGAVPGGSASTALTLARLLGQDSRVVLVGLSAASPELAAASADPAAPGLAELVRAEASFGDIITHDRMSGIHLVGMGQRVPDTAVLQSPRVGMALDALARVYDHVVMDAGGLDNLSLILAGTGAHAVVVCDAALPEQARRAMRGELLAAGFSGVTLLAAASDLRPGPRMAAA